MLFSAHQPQYLPWLGYFEKIDRADRFVLLDDVQYKKNEWQNRNRIKGAEGPQWITVPVKAHLGLKINETEIDNSKPWVKDHLKSLTTNYHPAPFYDLYYPKLEEFYQQKQWETIGEINVALIEYLLDLIGISKDKCVLSSSLNVTAASTERLVELGKKLKANAYLSGPDGKNYMDLALFEEANIEVLFQEYNHPEYPQLFSSFQSHLTVLDLLFNCGQQSLEILRQGKG